MNTLLICSLLHLVIFQIVGQKLTLEELPQVCAPDTIILIDLSGSVKGTAVADIKAAVHDFLDSK